MQYNWMQVKGGEEGWRCREKAGLLLLLLGCYTNCLEITVGLYMMGGDDLKGDINI